VIDPVQRNEAIACVEEPRFARGRLHLLPEFQRYVDPRRFLAVQMADARSEGFLPPGDCGELARLLLRGDVVEVPQVTEDWVFHDLGIDVEEDPRIHYDGATGIEVRLLASPAAWAEERERLREASRGWSKAARRARSELQRLAEWYDDAERARRLYAEWADVSALAHRADGTPIDLDDAAERARFSLRLLSCVRPEARGVLARVAHLYRQRFDRPLPIASLVRTLHYQRRLWRVNRNAARVDLPPHTTGMAFDISYRFMNVTEQNFLLEELARLKYEGRVEALRESNNSIHVYVFRNGPPSENAIEACLQDVENAHRQLAPRPHGRGRRARSTAARRRRS
jgi:hypothetical protein